MKKVCTELLLVFFLTSELFARAGGAGGDGISGGDGDFSFVFDIMIWIISLPFPWNVVVIGTLLLLFLVFRKQIRQQSILNKIPPTSESLPNKLKEMQSLAPDFDIIHFSEKVKTAFFKIQEAWSKQNIKPIRKFISDGMYQRFNAQFIMMKELAQENTVSDVALHQIKLIDVQVDGNFFVVDVALEASMNDRFISKKYPALSEGGFETFVEIWTFIRKIDLQKNGDLYHNIHCPQCGAPIDEIEGEISQCPYCKTVLNTGEFDWILCEITQADDYPIAKELAKKQSKFQQAISQLYKKDPHFSIQLLEDKASNAYTQIVIATALNDPKRIRRFSSDEFYAQFAPNEKIIYHRFYLNYVTLIGLWQKEDHDHAAFYIKSTFQRLLLQDKTFEKLDVVLRAKPEVLILQRHKDAVLPAGKIYAHQCPSCGGTLEDSTDITCPYCGATLNSPKHEWIVYTVLNPEEYSLFLVTGELPKKFDVKDDDLYRIKDYILNNTCVVLASDGQIDEKEIQFLQNLAQKLGYSPSKIQGLFMLAKHGKLKLLYPSNKKDAEKVYEYMMKAAQANDGITKEELKVISEYKKRLG